jgi:hypothetical protein
MVVGPHSCQLGIEKGSVSGLRFRCSCMRLAMHTFNSLDPRYATSVMTNFTLLASDTSDVNV